MLVLLALRGGLGVTGCWAGRMGAIFTWIRLGKIGYAYGADVGLVYRNSSTVHI